MIQIVPHYTVTPSSLVLYNLPLTKGGGVKHNKGWENLKDNTNHYGELSANARKRLQNKIDYMLYLTNPKLLSRCGKNTENPERNELKKAVALKNAIAYKLTFVTLTLPSKQVHSDNEIKSKCLNQFLVEIRKKYNVKKYIWKAEKQENGNIHFHILTDKFMHWRGIRNIWNRIVNKLGYVDAYSEKMREFFKNGFRLSDNPNDTRSSSKQFRAYQEGVKSNWSDPNSTDIHAISKINNIPAYMAKYMAKGVTKTERNSKISNNVSKMKTNIEQQNFLKLEYFNMNTTNKRRNEIKSEVEDLEAKFKALENETKELQKMGVEGKIWGCSETLQKCKNLTEVGDWGNVPDFEDIVQKCEWSTTFDVRNQQVSVFYFDINLFPNLKAVFDSHLSGCLSEDGNMGINSEFVA